ncbi:glucan endo-1,3-beta-glucosidase-like [Hevea brasiliensis]|uniref:glucan endo-1,3-beta-glucosidase-like n=1 Tax=Hevea brasiliensis TaxID=3981 RepID=UPI0025EE12E2|nr:glucan endo-1,3-beta-glucosidase-like [Hevea brasiliensis]
MLMWIQHFFFLYLFPPASLLFIILPNSIVGAPVGICYGRVASNLPPPSTVVNLLKSNGINDVRIFDADPETLLSFSGTGISLMVGVPNESLPSLANGNADTSAQWLQSNIFAYIPATQVKYIAVGNEVFLKDPFFTPYVVPALLNLYHALEILNLGNSIKLSSPQAASVLSSSYPPSSGMFDPYLESVIVPLLQFLYDSRSPFMVNAYPYISYVNNLKHVELDYALFKSRNPMQDGALEYRNLLDASVDALVYAMERERFSGIKVVVTETGWPTAGGEAASVENALAYNKEVVRRVVNDVGTPKRPREGMEAYLFSVYDENGKNGEDYEKHFGIFGLDGNKVYDLSFS